MYSRQDQETTGIELYGKVAPWVVIVLVVLAGWLARDALATRFMVSVDKARQETLPALGLAPAPPPGAGAPAASATPRKETVYRWVDKDGVAHYEQHEGRGREAVEVDQGRINSLNNYPAPAPAPAPGK